MRTAPPTRIARQPLRQWRAPPTVPKEQRGTIQMVLPALVRCAPTRECPRARYEKSTVRTVARARQCRPTPQRRHRRPPRFLEMAGAVSALQGAASRVGKRPHAPETCRSTVTPDRLFRGKTLCTLGRQAHRSGRVVRLLPGFFTNGKEPMHQKSIRSVAAGGRGFSASPMRRSDVLRQNGPALSDAVHTAMRRVGQNPMHQNGPVLPAAIGTTTRHLDQDPMHQNAAVAPAPIRALVGNARWHRGRHASRRAIAVAPGGDTARLRCGIDTLTVAEQRP